MSRLRFTRRLLPGRLISLLQRPGVFWAVCSVLLLGGALTGAAMGWAEEVSSAQALRWERGEPWAVWRCWTAAFVHFDARHLAFNMVGVMLVGVLGAAAALPLQAALAWAVAWPLGHAALWLAPAPQHYAGLSGVLHAGAAVAAVFLGVQGRELHRSLGAVLGLLLLIKLVQEQAWTLPVRQDARWDFPLAVVAHGTGALSGALIAGLMLAAMRLGRARYS